MSSNLERRIIHQENASGEMIISWPLVRGFSPLFFSLTEAEFQRAHTVLANHNIKAMQLADNKFRFEVDQPAAKVEKPPPAHATAEVSLNLSPEQQAAFIEMFTANYERLRGFFEVGCHDLPTAEDYTQTLFINALKAFSRFVYIVPDDPFGPWLIRSAQNLYITYNEKDQTYDDHTVDLELFENNLSCAYYDKYEGEDIEVAKLERVIRDLNAKENSWRAVAYFKTLHKLSGNEIAYILDKTEQAVKSIYVRFTRSVGLKLHAKKQR